MKSVRMGGEESYCTREPYIELDPIRAGRLLKSATTPPILKGHPEQSPTLSMSRHRCIPTGPVWLLLWLLEARLGTLTGWVGRCPAILHHSQIVGLNDQRLRQRPDTVQSFPSPLLLPAR